MSLLQLLIAIVFIFVSNVSAQDEADRLQLARMTFDRINNGCYDFQYKRDYIIPCWIQPMNIQVSNNEVEQVTFAEGNDFALDNFCYGDENELNGQLLIASRTIDDLFDMIQDAITRDWGLFVRYHETIGVPLGIFIDPYPDGFDDELIYSIFCIQFDPKCKSKPEMRGKSSSNDVSGGGNNDNKKIKKFNKKDAYSCLNVAVPDQCPLDRFKCNRVSNGCNTCSCDGRDTIGCTKRVCESYNYQDEWCMDCESNTQWTVCGNVADPTCDDDCGEPRCQCPASLPIWDGSECVRSDECASSATIASKVKMNNEAKSVWYKMHDSDNEEDVTLTLSWQILGSLWGILVVFSLILCTFWWFKWRKHGKNDDHDEYDYNQDL